MIWTIFIVGAVLTLAGAVISFAEHRPWAPVCITIVGAALMVGAYCLRAGMF